MRTLAALLAMGVGASAQTLAPVDQAGYPKLIASHRGHVVLVDFWATWCKPCRAEMPELAKLGERLRARGVDVIAISADEAEQKGAALKVLKEDGVSGAAYWKNAADDDKFNDAIDPNWGGALPAIFLYDRSGRKARSFIGETPVKDVEAAIAKLL